MPWRWNVVEPDVRLEGQLGQDRQLVGGVGAVDVEGRVGLGVAELLGLAQGLLVGQALAGHLGQDEVAGAVDDGGEALDLVGRQREPQGLDDRDSAADAPLEGDRPAGSPGLGEDRRPVLGQERLVGRDHVLARGQRSRARYCKAGSVPPMVSMMMSTSGSSISRDDSVVSRTPSSRTSRGLSRSRTAAQVQRIVRPARRAIRSACSVSSRATPVPTVPRPIMPIVTCSMSLSKGFCYNRSGLRQQSDGAIGLLEHRQRPAGDAVLVGRLQLAPQGLAVAQAGDDLAIEPDRAFDGSAASRRGTRSAECRAPCFRNRGRYSAAVCGTAL